MKNYRPLVLQELNIRLPGLNIRRLRLNRHLAKVDQRAAHKHRFAQFLLYLAGKGVQTIGSKTFEIEPGSLVFVSPGMSHAFRYVGNRPPLCLVIDFDGGATVARKSGVVRLSQLESGQIKHELSRLIQLYGLGRKAPLIQTSARILSIMGILTAQSRISNREEVKTSGITQRVDRLLRQSDGADLSIRELAKRAGYQPDYLNRIFKRESGLTLGQYRARQLVLRAKTLLSQCRRVQEVADELGFHDQNYFARWFRQQTGEQPRKYLSGGCERIAESA